MIILKLISHIRHIETIMNSIDSINNELSHKAVLKAFGERFRELRLAQNINQQQLSFESGVPLRTLSRLENGHAVSMDVLIKVLRALNLLERLELLVPTAEISPMQRKEKRAIKPRQRASGTRIKNQGVAEPSSNGWSGFKNRVLFEDKENK
jgi:transcriptional regulator with XRE-family HTH domain